MNQFAPKVSPCGAHGNIATLSCELVVVPVMTKSMLCECLPISTALTRACIFASRPFRTTPILVSVVEAASMVTFSGSLKNLYGPHYVNSRGIMSPWMWNGVETERPGADYDLPGFGMRQDFRLIY